MQLNYGGPSALTYAGDVVSDNKRIKSAPALEKIYAGLVVGYDSSYAGNEIKGYQHPSPNKLTFSTSLSTSNVINGNVTLKTIDSNGNEVITTTAISPVTYATSHAATMTAIQDAIEGAFGSCVCTVDTNSISVVNDSGAIVILSGFVVSGGSAVSVSYDFNGTLVGVAQRQPQELNDDGSVYIPPNEMVGALTQGIITVMSNDAMTVNSSFYT
jgi:hypothetical protein